MPLQHVEIYSTRQSSGQLQCSYGPTGLVVLLCRYSLPRLPRALNIAGAVDVSKIETVGGRLMMRVES